ncbi:MAG: hypothetical protein KUG78_16705 [Kangiellaceae bacterium]|nr:hypothetical protein [Kangiellaceae bacterium]
MKIIFKKIPKLALYLYILGFITIGIALANYFSNLLLMEELIMLQLFILGAIIVAIGSVVNTIYQFKKKH